MAAIAEADFDSDRLSALSIEKKNGPTDVKTQKAALYALSALSLFGAGVASTAAICSPVCAGLVLTSLFLALYSHSLTDYTDPATLAHIRTEALNQSLTEIVQAHGWQNLFIYALLDEEAFKTAYREQADTLSFERVLVFYREALGNLVQARRQGAGADFLIPSPFEWKNRFYLDTERLRIDLVAERFSLSELKAFEILGTEEGALFEEVKREIASYHDSNAALQEQFASRTATEYSLLQSVIEAAELVYAQHPAHRLLRQMRSYFCYHCGAFNHQYYSMIRDLECSLLEARETRERAIAAAHEQYRLAVLPVRREIDALILASKEQYELKISLLDQMYRAAIAERLANSRC